MPRKVSTENVCARDLRTCLAVPCGEGFDLLWGDVGVALPFGFKLLLAFVAKRGLRGKEIGENAPRSENQRDRASCPHCKNLSQKPHHRGKMRVGVEPTETTRTEETKG